MFYVGRTRGKLEQDLQFLETNNVTTHLKSLVIVAKKDEIN